MPIYKQASDGTRTQIAPVNGMIVSPGEKYPPNIGPRYKVVGVDQNLDFGVVSVKDESRNTTGRDIVTSVSNLTFFLDSPVVKRWV